MHPYLTFLGRLVLGSMWLAAAVGKFRPRTSRAEAVAGLGLLPQPAAAVVGAALPWVELALGGLLIIGQWTTAAAWVSAGLPARRYFFQEWRQAKVAPDYHVRVADHFYSVPYLLVGKEVEA
jgi:uncharacterized membrane protein YphA (DoxX/SURF4 family)